jgi:dolichyl-phosphate beta-glucosyltransferase
MKPPKFSLIIPAYQEATRIEPTLDALAKYLKGNNWLETEVVVVCATSTDGTADLARAKSKLFDNFRVIDAGPKVGKGRDVRTGIFEAKGAYKLFMDADLATPLHHLETIRELSKDGFQVAIGVRNLNQIHTGLRKWISSAGNFLIQVMLLPRIKDTQCGFKAFSAEAAEEMFGRQTILGWGFDMEVLAIARILGYGIKTIPIPDWTEQPDGTFEGAVKSAAAETLGELFVIFWRKWTGRYRNKSYNYEPYRS